MKYLLILFALILSACDQAPGPKHYNKNSNQQNSPSLQQMTIQACANKNGVPILNSYNRMVQCRFPPNPCKGRPL